jgi:hypothetical protein
MKRQRDVSQLGAHGGLVTFTSSGGETAADNGEFKNVLGNSIRVKNVVMIAPRLTVMPNVFDNITPYNNTITVNGVAYTIPVGYYTLSALITALNTALAALPIVFTAPVDPYNPALSVGGVATFIVFKNSEMGEVLGFPDANPLNPYLTSVAPQTLPFPPNLNHNPIYHLTCSEIASNSHVNEVGLTHSVLETLNMANVTRGAYATTFRDQAEMSVIEFDSPRELSRITMYVVDSKFRRVTMPGNYNTWIQCRVWSVDR